MRDVCKKQEKCKIHQYTNGIILPRKIEGAEPRWGLGGVCDAQNQFVEQSCYDGGWTSHGGKYDWEQEVYLKEEVVYVGIFFRHWGHFLIDLTGRMWCLPHLKKDQPHLKIAFLGEEEIEGTYLEFFEMLGFPKEELIHITKPTRFKKVILPELAFRGCLWYTDEFVDLFDYLADAVLQDQSMEKQYGRIKKIYFTRRNFQKARSSEFGEEYVESCFLKNGYERIAPEELPLKEQIYLWNYADSIVCLNGTIPLNVIFSKKKELDLIILNKTSLEHKNPYILLEMREIHVEFINTYKEPLRSYPKSLGEGPYLLHAGEEFQQFLKKRKFRLPEIKGGLKFYQWKQEMKYFWCVLGVKQRMRRVLSNLVSESFKGRIRKIRGIKV